MPVSFIQFLDEYGISVANQEQVATMVLAYQTYLLRKTIIDEADNMRRWQENTLKVILPEEDETS